MAFVSRFHSSFCSLSLHFIVALLDFFFLFTLGTFASFEHNWHVFFPATLLSLLQSFFSFASYSHPWALGTKGLLCLFYLHSVKWNFFFSQKWRLLSFQNNAKVLLQNDAVAWKTAEFGMALTATLQTMFETSLDTAFSGLGHQISRCSFFLGEIICLIHRFPTEKGFTRSASNCLPLL